MDWLELGSTKHGQLQDDPGGGYYHQDEYLLKH